MLDMIEMKSEGYMCVRRGLGNDSRYVGDGRMHAYMLVDR